MPPATTGPSKGTLRRRSPQSRLRAERSAYARDFVDFVQANEVVMEISKRKLLALHRDYARQRKITPLSDAQLFRALGMIGVSSRQVEICRAHAEFKRRAGGRQRQTVYRLPRPRKSAEGTSANAPEADATRTPLAAESGGGHAFAAITILVAVACGSAIAALHTLSLL